MGHFKHVVAAVALISAIILPQAVAAQQGNGGGTERAYVVILEDSTNPNWVDQIIQYVYGQVIYKYDSAFNGATVLLTPDEAEELDARSEVKSVFEEIAVSVDAQVVPTGIRRIDTPNINGGGANTPIHVAIIDTGIDLDHPDLNVGSGVNCINPSSSPNDDHGHGTHVAGTIGALDNSIGVAGVAPGAVVHPVKVLAADGYSRDGSVACGLEWVLDNAGLIDIVNMSLGGTLGSRDEDNCGLGNGDAYHQLICAIVNAGIPVVVAAGNENRSTTYVFPARYQEAITVSALVDSDSLAGGNGPMTSRGPDDTMANFSNYGSHVDVIAPGVNILSSVPGGYGYKSGTSMASPHVAGAAALYLAQNPGASPAQIDSALKSTGNLNWTGDKDAWKEPLINAGELVGDSTPPTESVDAEVVSASASPTTLTQNSGNVTITAAVRNNGDDPAAIPVSVSGPGGYSDSATTGTLASGQSQNVQFTWPASLTGTHSFQVTAALGGDGTPANDSKTTNAVTVNPVPSVSIYVAGISITTSEYQTRAGTAFQVAASVNVAATTGSGAGATVSGRFTFPGGATQDMVATANSSGVAQFETRSQESGVYSLLVTNVQKSGMTYNPGLDVNNPADHDTAGGTPPPAVIDAQVVSASAAPATITQNSGNVTITASIRNNGDAAAAIPVSISGPGGYSDSATTATLASGQSQNVQFTWPASLAGSHTFQVTTNLAGDSVGSNNSRTTNSVTVNAPGGGGDPAIYVAEVDVLTRGSNALYFRGYVEADGGASTTGAEVKATIAGPNGSPIETAVVNSRGYAQFSLIFPPSGNYTLTVTDIVLPGFTYDEELDTDNPTTINF